MEEQELKDKLDDLYLQLKMMWDKEQKKDIIKELIKTLQQLDY